MQEIDYELEGRNADRFRRNFAGTSWVKVPRVYWPQTSMKVCVSLQLDVKLLAPAVRCLPAEVVHSSLCSAVTACCSAALLACQ